MSVRPVTGELIGEAADVLAEAMLDDLAAEYLVPDPVERLEFHRLLFRSSIERALDSGRVDAWGDPIVGVAIWLRRPPVTESLAAPARSTVPPEASRRLGPDGTSRAERFRATMRRLRELARPDGHAYLDSVGVLRAHRRRGIATALLEAGHHWADAAGIPCALDTLTDANIAFYRKRGYRVVAEAAVPDSDLVLTAMRRGSPRQDR